MKAKFTLVKRPEKACLSRVYRRRRYTLKLVCDGAAKQVSAGVAPCNMVSFVKNFRTFVARQESKTAFYYSAFPALATV